MSHSGWIGVDLDGTLAEYHGWRGFDHIGDPVMPMVERVKQWLKEGKEVKIFTARVCRHGEKDKFGKSVDAVYPIMQWCKKHIGRPLEVTNKKDMQMIELWDDRAVQVVPNTGIPFTRL